MEPVDPILDHQQEQLRLQQSEQLRRQQLEQQRRQQQQWEDPSESLIHGHALRLCGGTG